MAWPTVRLHQLYSLNLYDGLDVIFEDLDMLDLNSLKDVLTTKNVDDIQFVKNIFSINTKEKYIKLIGNKINNSTYIINRAGKGDIMIIKYNCKDSDIITAVEYLYHMYTTLRGLKTKNGE